MKQGTFARRRAVIRCRGGRRSQQSARPRALPPSHQARWRRSRRYRCPRRTRSFPSRRASSRIPRRDYNPGSPVSYPDPDIITIDPAFAPLRVNNTAIQRLFTGGMWDEGPAWCAQGRYLVWSDIPNDRQLRYIEDDGRVTVFRQPSNNSNGNTFDHQGRQLSCEHRGRRLVRYEHDGSVSVIAEFFEGKHLNSPNDVACHIDGSYWFTDPPPGASLYEGMPDAPGGLRNVNGLLNGKVGQPVGSGVLKGELPSNIYRADPSGRVDMLISEEAFGGGGNGITFSPDYKKVYIVSRQAGVELRHRRRRQDDHETRSSSPISRSTASAATPTASAATSTAISGAAATRARPASAIAA